MRRCFRFLLVGLLFAICRGLAAGPYPSIAGSVRGELKLFEQKPDFTLPWKCTFKAIAEGGQGFAFAIDGAGAHLRATGQMDLVTGEGSWKINEAQVEASAWFAAVASRLSPALAGLVAEGNLTVTGEGTLRQGQAVGRIKIVWRDGALRQAVQGWALEGIGLQGEFALDSAAARVESVGPFELTVKTVTTSRFGARNVLMNGRLNERRGLSVLGAQVEIAGGQMTVDPCEVPLSPLVVDANLRISQVGLQDIVLLVPTAGLSDARGRIDGVVRVKWNETLGVQLGVGSLTVRDDEPAIVRLTPSAGLLTRNVPEHFDLLPAWLGPLARWMRPANPAYANMKAIELGEADLRVKALDVQLTPEGDERGRSAVVRLVAQPAQPDSAVKEVVFDVNVAGPVNAVLKLGLDQGFTLGTR